MKRILLFMCLMAAVAVTGMGLAGCQNDAAEEIDSDFVGTWKCDRYYVGDEYNVLYPMRNDLPETTVVLNADGTCSGQGVVINGNGSFTIKTYNKNNTGYWAVFTFVQNGETVCTATLVSFTNDHKEGYLKLSGYDNKTFIFKRQ